MLDRSNCARAHDQAGGLIDAQSESILTHIITWQESPTFTARICAISAPLPHATYRDARGAHGYYGSGPEPRAGYNGGHQGSRPHLPSSCGNYPRPPVWRCPPLEFEKPYYNSTACTDLTCTVRVLDFVHRVRCASHRCVLDESICPARDHLQDVKVRVAGACQYMRA